MNASKKSVAQSSGKGGLGLIDEGVFLIDGLRKCSNFEISKHCDRVNRYLCSLSEHNAKLFQFVKYVLGLDLKTLSATMDKIYGVEVKKQHVKFLAKEWLLSSTICHVVTGELGCASKGLSDWVQQFEGCIPESDRSNKTKRVHWLCLWRLDQHVKLLKMKDPDCWNNVHKAFPNNKVGVGEMLLGQNENSVQLNDGVDAVGAIKEGLHERGFGSSSNVQQEVEDVFEFSVGPDSFGTAKEEANEGGIQGTVSCVEEDSSHVCHGCGLIDEFE